MNVVIENYDHHPFVLSAVEGRAANAAPYDTSFDCAQDEQWKGLDRGYFSPKVGE